jgi:hypothetical protein
VTTTPLPDLPDFCWPVDTSCVSDWDSEDYTDAERAQAVAAAQQTLVMLTAGQVGGCPVTVRPCSERCRRRTWETYPVAGPGGGAPWRPFLVSGEWINIGCGHQSGCGCLGARELRLGRASSVQQVMVDGAVLDPSAWRLDPGGLLVRTDGDSWPLCQDMTAPDTETGTWSVTYTLGAPVDGLGALAAGALAGEYLQLCTGGPCSLPDTVSQIQRQGVTITITPGAFPNGLTGIRQVDMYVQRYNPNKLARVSGVYSPDVRPPRRVGERG